MAAFSFQQHILDPVFYSNPPHIPTNKIIPSFSHMHHEQNTNLFFSQFYQAGADMDFVGVSSSVDPSVSNKQSPASSSVVHDQKLEIGDEQVTQKLLINPTDKKRKYKNGSAQSKDAREVMIKAKKQKKRSIMNGVEDIKGKDQNKEVVEEAAGEAPPTGYIHVRARRGQATDSHSLAERVRREKISERMKLLQALVPGCDKVTGKALMLDEIINYVQSLQNQVEFLSMKLASVNPMLYDFGVDLDAFMVKPDQSLSSLEAHVEQCSPNGTTNTFNTANNYSLVDSSTAASLILEQGEGGQIPNNNILSQGQGNGVHAHVLWGMDEERQKIINESTLGNNLSCFH